MTERENALRVINHTGTAEWIPYSGDCYDIINPASVVRERPAPGTGSGYDWFGCWWEFDPELMGYSPIPGKHPVTDITLWREQVHFPNLEEINWENAKNDIAHLNREEKCSLFFWESGPWERVHALVGFEEALVALYEEPEAVLELIEAITDYKLKCLEYIAEYYKPDMILNLDDAGHQQGAFMSTDMYREFILPSEVRIGNAVREYGIIYAQHSCGKIDTFFGDILESKPATFAGLFAPYNDIIAVEEKYADLFVVDGGLNNQLLLTADTTDEEIIQEIRRCIDTIAPYKNLIVNPGYVPDKHREQLIRDEVRSYGKNYWKRHGL